MKNVIGIKMNIGKHLLDTNEFTYNELITDTKIDLVNYKISINFQHKFYDNETGDLYTHFDRVLTYEEALLHFSKDELIFELQK